MEKFGRVGVSERKTDQCSTYPLEVRVAIGIEV